MYILRPLVYKTGIYRSYKIVLTKKHNPRVNHVKMKFCSFNNFKSFTKSSVLYLRYGVTTPLKHMKTSGFFGLNKVAGKALGNAIGINFRSYNYVKHKRKRFN